MTSKFFRVALIVDNKNIKHVSPHYQSPLSSVGMGCLSSLSSLLLLYCLLILEADANVTVETQSGRVRGAIKEWRGQDGLGTYYSFRGIPYAKPPVGDLVWRDPQPVSPWDGEVGN